MTSHPGGRRRRVVIAAFFVSLLLAGGAAFFLLAPGGEVLDLAAEGGEIQLRTPMRPIRGETRVLLFALDGVGAEAFMEIIGEGLAPATARLLGRPVGDGVFENAYVAPDALTILPSTTMAAWASIFTGEPAGRTGVPGNEWFERETMRFLAPGPVSIEEHDHSLKMYTEGLVANAVMVPTLFEQVDLRAHVSMQMVHRGADLLTVPAASDVAALFGRVAAGVADGEPASRELFSTMDDRSVEGMVEGAERHGLPDLQVVYFGGIDLYTHQAEGAHEQKKLYFRDVVDPAVARVLDVYERAGVLDDTFVVFVSDHGHTPVLDDERHALGTSRESDPPAVLERLGYRVRPFELEPESDDFQAVLAYQGAIAYLYLADRSTCPGEGDRCSWTLPPRLEEDVLPVARALDRANRYGELVPELRETLDLVLAREPKPPGEDALPFQVWNGDRLMPVGEYLAANPRPDLLDLEQRLRDLAEGPFGHRAGDVLLIARSGMDRPLSDRFYFSSVYRSWHGSPAARDSRMTFAVAHRPSGGEALRERLRGIAGERPSQLHVTPLVRDLLGR
jgi:hypothetical protein